MRCGGWEGEIDGVGSEDTGKTVEFSRIGDGSMGGMGDAERSRGAVGERG
jgi:hypothetical protein